MFSTSFTWNDMLFLLDGAWVTLQLTFWSIMLGSVAGLVFGLLRALLPRASLPLAWVLDVFRSVPLLIQFVLFNSFKSIVGLNISAFSVGCIVLGCTPRRTSPRSCAAVCWRYRPACAGPVGRWA